MRRSQLAWRIHRTQPHALSQRTPRCATDIGLSNEPFRDGTAKCTRIDIPVSVAVIDVTTSANGGGTRGGDIIGKEVTAVGGIEYFTHRSCVGDNEAFESPAHAHDIIQDGTYIII